MIKEKQNIDKAMAQIRRTNAGMEQHSPIPFDAFLDQVSQRPAALIRNVLQLFHDMAKAYVGTGVDEYPGPV